MALKNAVDFLNAFRMISGADNYNGGRDAIKAENSNVSSLILICFWVTTIEFFVLSVIFCFFSTISRIKH